jgi:hypothetical protein
LFTVPTREDGLLDLTSSNEDYSVFLPSISSIYARIVSLNLTYKRQEGLSKGLTRSWDDLDFLSDKGELFNYKWALYSAGHAQHDLERSNSEEKMIQSRDRNKSIIIGDSGGFQAATGVLKWPWKPKKNQDDVSWKNDQNDIRMNILRWLEHTADWSMIFDFPTGGLDRFGVDEKTGLPNHPGLKSFKDCLDGTIENAKFFMKHRREGDTKFMNVLQGRNQQEGDEWWDVVKDWPFESWAFANVQGFSLALNIRRLIIMRDGGYLNNGQDWIHYLGNGKIKAGCNLTTLQRTLRKHVNPNVTLSYDAASPFVMTAKGHIYNTYNISPKELKFKGSHIPDQKELKGSTTLFKDWIYDRMVENKYITDNVSTFDDIFEHQHTRHPFFYETAISKRITLGDICCKGYEDVNSKELEETNEFLQQAMGLMQYGQVNQRRIKYQSSLDGLSYVLLMNHNVELHIRACQEACYWMSQPINIARHHIPSDVLEFKDLCEEIFITENPMSLIDKNWTLLSYATGMDADNQTRISLDSI